MIKYLLKKSAELLIVMILVSFFSFAVIYFAPGDISSMYINEEMTPKEKEMVKEALGINEPLTKQYWNWAKEAIKGNFGFSHSNRKPVMPQLISRLPQTFLLMGTAMVLSLVIAIPLGLLAGRYHNQWLDTLISGFSYIGMSIPSFWFAIVLIILFSVKLRLLPSSGMNTVGNATVADTIQHMILPCITLSISNIAVYIRYIRSSTIKELGEEYVLTAKAKGTSSHNILKKHVLKNTLLPIITLLGMSLTSLVTGSFIIETVFGWPGIGTFAMSAIGNRDFPVIMAYVILSCGILVVGNFLADILYALVDPRISKES